VNLANGALITNEISICVRLSLTYTGSLYPQLAELYINNLLLHKQQQLENNEYPPEFIVHCYTHSHLMAIS